MVTTLSLLSFFCQSRMTSAVLSRTATYFDKSNANETMNQFISCIFTIHICLPSMFLSMLHLDFSAELLPTGLISQQSGSVDRVHRVIKTVQRRTCHRRHLLVHGNGHRPSATNSKQLVHVLLRLPW